jgi:hypothetical protein
MAAKKKEGLAKMPDVVRAASVLDAFIKPKIAAEGAFASPWRSRDWAAPVVSVCALSLRRPAGARRAEHLLPPCSFPLGSRLPVAEQGGGGCTEGGIASQPGVLHLCFDPHTTPAGLSAGRVAGLCCVGYLQLPDCMLVWACMVVRLSPLSFVLSGLGRAVPLFLGNDIRRAAGAAVNVCVCVCVLVCFRLQSGIPC